jgi:hypothetical protein
MMNVFPVFGLCSGTDQAKSDYSRREFGIVALAGEAGKDKSKTTHRRPSSIQFLRTLSEPCSPPSLFIVLFRTLRVSGPFFARHAVWMLIQVISRWVALNLVPALLDPILDSNVPIDDVVPQALMHVSRTNALNSIRYHRISLV